MIVDLNLEFIDMIIDSSFIIAKSIFGTFFSYSRASSCGKPVVLANSELDTHVDASYVSNVFHESYFNDSID
jgi:hypothetical protein